MVKLTKKPNTTNVIAIAFMVGIWNKMVYV
jgi:hypothetical protein